MSGKRVTVIAVGLFTLTAMAGQSMASGAPRGPAAPGPGIAVMPDLPEPGVAQFEPGKSTVVPATAPPATDIKPADPANRLAAAGTYTCQGFSNIDDPNPVANLYLDTFTWGPYAPYKVGNGSGNINWRLNPYKNPSWYMWFHSLRWLGQGIIAGSQGDTTALTRVATIARDWVNDNPYTWAADVGAYESTTHRTNALLCLRLAVLSGLGVTALPAAYAWIDPALHNHAKFLLAHWSGAWNHGTDESIALFGLGCTLNRSDYKTTAQTRLAAGITTAIDTQGSTNEQSTAYAQFNYTLWGRAITVLEQCGADPGTTISTRRALLNTWLTLATNSFGKLHQIGDSEVIPTYPWAGTTMEYASTRGAQGTTPTQRVGVYGAGYIFGRTGWGATRPFEQEATYSIRFGPVRALHGHSDHTAITYTARGREILIDAGHAGYQNDVWKTWVKSPFGHSELTTPLTADRWPATKLNRYAVNPTAEFYEFSDSPGIGISRVRAVLVLKDPDLVVTMDQATSKTAQQFQTLWHLPSDQKATVSSRSTAVAMKPGDTTRTIIFQVPFRQPLPAGAILVKQGQTNPIQGWHYPNIFTRNSAPTVMMARSGLSASVFSFIVPVPATGGVTYTTKWSGTTFYVNLKIAGQPVTIGVSGGGSLFRLP